MSNYVLFGALGGMMGLGSLYVTSLKTKMVYPVLTVWLLSFFLVTWQISLLQGQPKLISTETRDVTVAQVLWYKINPKERIYVLLTWKGLKEPLYYSIPWDANMEKQMGKANTKALAHNTPMMMRNPFSSKNRDMDGDGSPGKSKIPNNGNSSQDDDVEGDQNFYAAPPPASVPKADSGENL